MARKTDVYSVSNIDTVIGSGVSLKGNLISDGDVAVDGTLAGNIKSGGHVTIGVNGRIEGNIQATSAEVGGKIEGTIRVLDAVSLLETAQVQGDIETGRLQVALGAIFIGTSKMKPVQATEIATREDVTSPKEQH